VKTYAYTLMLLKEKLEDQGVKKVELDRAMAEKKLELMASLQQKLASVGKIDDKLDREVKALVEQVSAWREQDEANKPKAKRAAALNVMRT
jgi:DNA uptake protein ComE-like DNA-binding protein